MKLSNLIGCLVAIGLAIAAIQDLKHKGLFYKMLPQAMKNGVDSYFEKK